MEERVREERIVQWTVVASDSETMKPGDKVEVEIITSTPTRRVLPEMDELKVARCKIVKGHGVNRAPKQRELNFGSSEKAAMYEGPVLEPLPEFAFMLVQFLRHLMLINLYYLTLLGKHEPSANDSCCMQYNSDKDLLWRAIQHSSMDVKTVQSILCRYFYQLEATLPGFLEDVQYDMHMEHIGWSRVDDGLRPISRWLFNCMNFVGAIFDPNGPYEKQIRVLHGMFTECWADLCAATAKQKLISTSGIDDTIALDEHSTPWIPRFHHHVNMNICVSTVYDIPISLLTVNYNSDQMCAPGYVARLMHVIPEGAVCGKRVLSRTGEKMLMWLMR